MPSMSIELNRWVQCRTVLLDIEGTISSISFVKDVLYAYALDRLTTLARHSWDDPAFQDLIAGFPEETKADAQTLLAHVEDLTRRDVKAVYLKQLQGKIWKTGYDNGDLKTPLFDDVIPTLGAWKGAGKTLAVFSSGSVQAQLQFFSVVEDGSTTRDLKPLFAAHFDPTIAGSKLETKSYEKICRDLGQEAAEVTFLTDNVKEAEAATDAGVLTILVDRPGNAPLSQESRARFPVIQKLTDLP
ncbi:2,3-diketo-5-methylthio-1-phosphopentane phosphatase [Trematosphaeria pertusa]|uniref:2,3-diketo-5-methylthio-1-phosphopentane phosphatase n=1 Tax=Trematosphaeria pertusa TaxID=390896 RepID=A0A6A6IL50_9PLEO|nr:2,3-diketo-5-methylthio-1-phosphopentane phosphatase [Trematosphaeria pertusa]KAF2250572.1 2,3-diketo-5-methylthio-1-phosphopentane phosphatase [Trematosphaeria pertusa]